MGIGCKKTLVIIAALLSITAMHSPRAFAWNGPKKGDLEQNMRNMEYDKKGYPIAGHAFIIKRAIELLRNDANLERKTNPKEAAFKDYVAAKMDKHLYELYKGTREADNSGKRVMVVYKICFGRKYSWEECVAASSLCFASLGFNEIACGIMADCAAGILINDYCKKIEIPWLSTASRRIGNLASYEHYLPGLQIIAEQLAGEPLVEWLGSFFDLAHAASLCRALLVMSCEFGLSEKLQPVYRGADEVALQHYNYAIALMKKWLETGGDNTNLENKAFFELGWALHLLADMTVPHHVNNSFLSNHQEFEDKAEGKGRLETYNAVRTGKYMRNWNVKDYVRKLAKITKSTVYMFTGDAKTGFELVRDNPESDWEKVLKYALKTAELYTAGLMWKFIKDVDQEWSPPLRIKIHRFPGGVPLGSSYVFYRMASRETGPWRSVRTDKDGYVELPLRRNARYRIQPAMPGWIRVRPDGTKDNMLRPYTHRITTLSNPETITFVMKKITGYNNKPSRISFKHTSGKTVSKTWRDESHEINFDVTTENLTLVPLLDQTLGLPNQTLVRLELRIVPNLDFLWELYEETLNIMVDHQPPRLEELGNLWRNRRWNAFKLLGQIFKYGGSTEHTRRGLALDEFASYMKKIDSRYTQLQTVQSAYLKQTRKLKLKRYERIPKVTTPPSKLQLPVKKKPRYLSWLKPELRNYVHLDIGNKVLRKLERGDVVRVEICPGYGYTGRYQKSRPLEIKLRNGKGAFLLTPGMEAGQIRFKVTIVNQSLSYHKISLVGRKVIGTVNVQPYLLESINERANKFLYPSLIEFDKR